MMTRRNSRTYQTAAAAHSKVIAARQELAAERQRSAQEEPMHRYPHLIQSCPVQDSLSCTDHSAALTQVLEQLSCQSQLLIDLLGAVNSLTAALLAQRDKL